MTFPESIFGEGGEVCVHVCMCVCTYMYVCVRTTTRA
jgi:hypothetical protein